MGSDGKHFYAFDLAFRHSTDGCPRDRLMFDCIQYFEYNPHFKPQTTKCIRFLEYNLHFRVPDGQICSIFRIQRAIQGAFEARASNMPYSLMQATG
jgi:hypothetical protein